MDFKRMTGKRSKNRTTRFSGNARFRPWPAAIVFLTLLGLIGGGGAGCTATLSGDQGDSGPLPGFDFGSGDGSETDGFQACVATDTEVSLRPLDILLAVDLSLSMLEASKWERVRPAITSFIRNGASRGLGVGLQYFPVKRPCRLESYQDPVVPIGTLPEAKEALLQSIEDNRNNLLEGTPMAPMLHGALDSAKKHALANGDRKTIIVIATDGVPGSCRYIQDGPAGNALEDVVQLAGDGVQGSPSILTFVIGVGEELSDLNQISRAGGTDQALLIDSVENTQNAFFAALQEIRENAIFCQFEVPVPKNGKLDLNRVAVSFDTGSGPEVFNNIGSPEGCAGTGGWYFDDPRNPKQIKLCGSTCETVRDNLGGKLNVRFACEQSID